MITASKQNLSGVEYKGETFGELFECNFKGAVFEGCVFTGAVTGCNFQDAVFPGCLFAAAIFNGCNLTDAAGLYPLDIKGVANNFEGVV